MPATVSTAKPDTFTGAAGMWAVAAEIAVIYVLSTVPTPLYVVYQQEFHFSHVTLTLIYAAYVVGTVAAMFLFGRLADQIGRRLIVLAALLIAATSAVVFLLAVSTGWLFPARILSGLAIALASGASTAWIVELEPRHDKKVATQVAIGANLVGLGLGALLAGVLAQYAPWPLRLVYVLFLGMLIPVTAVVWRTQKTIQDPTPLNEVSVRPRLGVPREIRMRFFSSAIAAFAVFSVLGFYAALIPSLLTRALAVNNLAIAGGVVAAMFFVGTAAVAFRPALKSHTGLVIALVLLLPGIGLLVAAEELKSLSVLAIGTAIGGVATGLGYRCSLQAVNDMAPEDRRSEVVSAYLIACYCGISLPVVGIGFLGEAVNPWIADLVFAAVIATLAGIALAVEIKSAPATSRQ